MKTNETMWCWLLAVVFGGAVVAPEAPGQRGWGDGFFGKKVLGSFAPEVTVEPIPEDHEQEYLNEVLGLIRPDASPEEKTKGQTMLEEALEKELSDSGEAVFRFTLGNLFFLDRNDKVNAAKQYLGAIEKYGDFLRAHKNVGIIFSRANKHENAVKHLAKAVSLGEFNDTVFGLLGDSYLKLGRAGAAETAFRQAALLAPDAPEWKVGLVQSLLGGGKAEAALKEIDPLLAASPDETMLWMFKLDGHIKTKDYLAAASVLEMLDAMGSAGADELTTLGDIYANELLLSLAAGAYLRAYESDPGSVERPLKAAEVLVERDGMDLAEELLKRVREGAGGSLDKAEKLRVMRVEARIAFSRGRGEEAAAMLEEVVVGDPLDGPSLLKLGDYYAAEGKNALAERRYESAGLIEATAADANVNYGKMLVGLGRYDEAVTKLRRAQEVTPREVVARFLEELEDYVKRRQR